MRSSLIGAILATLSVAAASASSNEAAIAISSTTTTTTTTNIALSEVELQQRALSELDTRGLSDAELEKRGLLDPIFCLFGNCINTATDPLNCGAVGKVCPTAYPNGSGAQCVNSVCMPKTCATGFGLSTTLASCVSLSTTDNCGTVGNKCAIANALTQACVSGSCVPVTCATGYQVSAGQCQKVYNLLTDPLNCGAIRKVCPTSYANGAGSICSAGICQPVSCNTGYAFSVASGTCQNVLNDLSNCGAIGNVCSFANGAGSCTNGICTLSSCNSGFYNVNDVCQFLQLASDPNNCGAVGNVCKFANGVGSCQSSKCTFTSCATNYKLVGNACQLIDYNTDPLNCGVAGYTCPASFANGGSGVCVGGKCTTTCNSGYQFDTTLNFCRSVSNDAQNCGRIGFVCSIVNGIASCSNGVCGTASCNSGYKLVSGTCQAINYSTDVNNCGSAGNVCPSSYANGGTGVCAAGKCMTTCNSGYAFDAVNNFCRNTANDIANCGSIGFTCAVPNAASQTCVAGSCQATTCAAGFNLVNGQCSAVNMLTDLANCGSLGHVCTFSPSGATGICSNGQCIVTACPIGYYVNGGICTLMPSQKAQLLTKKSKIPKKRTLCPAHETACPIAGSTSFTKVLSVDKLAPLDGKDPAGGYECIDTQTSLDSCGGCASTGEGTDCTALPHVAGVGCDRGECVIFTCGAGYRVSLDGKKCVRAGSPARNATKPDSRRHLHNKRQHQQRLSHHHIS